MFTVIGLAKSARYIAIAWLIIDWIRGEIGNIQNGREFEELWE